MDKTLGTVGTLVIAICLFLLRPGCTGIESQPNYTENQSTFPNQTSPTQNRQYTENGHLIVGSFNVKDFGRAKMSNPSVVNTLVDIIKRFDLLAIQELSNKDQSVIPRLMEYLEASGATYNYVVGPRQGFSFQKEQYVYLYDTSKLEIIQQPFVVNDPTQQIEREPLAIRFRCLDAPPERAFTFAMLNLHASPERRELTTELTQLNRLMTSVFQSYPEEDDFLIAGDFNCPPSYFAQFNLLGNQFAVIRDDWATNVRGNRNMDNIVIDSQNTREFLNQSGVLNMASEYGLTQEEALMVSDHLPVWAVFSTTETSPVTLTQAPRINR